MAQRALNLYDADPRSPGAQHVQSQRFCNASWKGLRPQVASEDPALRSLVESLATGTSTLSDLAAIENPNEQVRSLLKWLAGFRSVPCLH